jgi:DNA-binding Lrp family transcriptional regulator
MGRRLKVHITATLSLEAAQFLEETAERVGLSRSEVLDSIIRWAKKCGYPDDCQE